MRRLLSQATLEWGNPTRNPIHTARGGDASIPWGGGCGHPKSGCLSVATFGVV